MGLMGLLLLLLYPLTHQTDERGGPTRQREMGIECFFFFIIPVPFATMSVILSSRRKVVYVNWANR
jgi:hypothetical protein